MAAEQESVRLSRYAWLSIGAAVASIAIKGLAWRLTSSISLLSDALESIVNLIAALVALFALHVAEKPADEQHPHGHEKIEYFSSGLEGAMIFAAATAIVMAAIPRLLAPRALTELGLGLIVNMAASAINLVVALVLIHAGKQHRSIVLEADGRHLMTDVWTSVGVLIGLVLVMMTRIAWLDPVVALLVALNILVTGYRLLYRSATGLLDVSIPGEEHERIVAVLRSFHDEGVGFHAVRTRQAGTRTFVTVHVLVPGNWSVQHGHALAERVESAICALAPKMTVLTHVEPIEDACSYDDEGLDRH